MIKHILAGLVLICLAASCSDETKLEGKWQMQWMETDGVRTAVDTVYYNFQNNLFMFQYRITADQVGSVYGYKELKNDDQTLVLEIDDREGPNTPNSAATLERFYQISGWEEATHTFTVDKLTRSKLILSDDKHSYIFRKF